ncbi:MAG: AmmeMemoRadiSam system protein B [Planctomycetales bacterium]|nr:AmmeMemoRadiSam system protein B [Planctomycetales bacterium]
MTEPLRPRARPLEAIPVVADGRRLFLLRDPTGVSDKEVLLPPAALLVLSLCDGKHDVAGIQAEVTKRAGEAVPEEKIRSVLEQMDAAFLLDSEGFRAHREKVVAEFRARPTRPAGHAGLSYPADPGELAPWLRGFFSAPGGPGGPPRPAASGAGNGSLRGVLAPHLDFRRGALGYAHAYRALAEAPPPELVVLLGVAHASPESPFVATRKDFETPFGTVPTDREALARVEARAGYDMTADEWTHKGEHSAEFQAVWLRHLFPPEAAPKLRILPLLVSSFHRFVEGGRSPLEDPRIAGTIEGLREVLREAGAAARVVGGVDLSHVGPRYGDGQPVTPGKRVAVESYDQAVLRPALAGDAERWFSAVAAEADRTRICGLSAIWSFLSLLPAAPGRMLKYGQADDPPTGSIVSYAAVAYSTA